MKWLFSSTYGKTEATDRNFGNNIKLIRKLNNNNNKTKTI